MKFSELIKGIEYSCQSDCPEDPEISSITLDSRIVTPGAVFVCIKGMDTDGHNFAQSAYGNGARAFVAEHELADMPANCVIIIVPDTHKVLAQISSVFYGHPDRKLKVVGITGTKGKTSVAQMICQTLVYKGISAGYIGTNGVDFGNTHYSTKNTTPEIHDLLKYMRKMVDNNVKYVILEVSSQALKVGRIDGIHFDTCIFTNLSRDHIGAKEHSTFDEYRDCKRSLFTNYNARTIIYNADDPHAEYMINSSSAKKLISVSTDPATQAQYTGVNFDIWRDETHLGISYDCCVSGRIVPVRIPFPGSFSMINSMIVISFCQTCGISPEECESLLEKVSVTGRFEVIRIPEKPNVTFVIDYAHNGVSMTSTLGSVRMYTEKPGRVICLFGSVGGRSFERRKELGDAAATLADFCILTSDNPNHEPPAKIIDDIAESFDNNPDSCPYVKIPDREKAIEYAVQIAEDGDIVLLAGKGHEDYQLIDGVNKPFSERNLIEGYARKYQANGKIFSFKGI